MSKPLKIAVNTGGGDAPGLNAVIHAVTLAAHRRGWEVIGIKFGYRGLIDTSRQVVLTPELVEDIAGTGGTILGTVNKGDPFNFKTTDDAGNEVVQDISDQVVENFKAQGFDALIAIGGDGSLRIANKLAAKGIPVVGVPKTIDNDLGATDYTFGFDTACSNATDAIDKLRTTARAHERTFVVELMGRDAGWIALQSGIAASADVVLIPEIPFRYGPVFEKIRECYASPPRYAIVVVSEGAKAAGGNTVILRPGELGRARRLGGIGSQVAEEIEAHTQAETRVLVLGHLQRGGAPTSFDRVLAQRLGAAAVRAIEDGQFGKMVALRMPDVVTVAIADAIGENRRVPRDSELIHTARELGICLG